MKTFFRGRQTWLEARLQEEVLPVPREHTSNEIRHACVFFGKRGILFLRGALSLLLLSTIAAVLFSPVQHSFAKQETAKQLFAVFCQFYYSDEKDSKERDQDTHVCQGQSSAFGSLLKQDAPKGSNQWPAQASLNKLAKQKLLQSKGKALIQSQEDFANSIPN
jgi:hypothetical protein